MLLQAKVLSSAKKIGGEVLEYKDSVCRLKDAIILGLIFCISISITIKPEVVADPDFGWHIMAGKWIFEHKAVPVTDPFSIYGQGKLWVAYSWLYELLIYAFEEAFDLAGIVFFTALMAGLITLALLSLLHQVSSNPIVIAATAAITLFTLSPLLAAPRPWLFTILFFTVTLDGLLRVEQRNDFSLIKWLPLVFIVWSNTHIQFIYGLFIIGLYVFVGIFRIWIDSALNDGSLDFDERAFSLQKVGFIFVACILGTLLTPYNIRLYETVFYLVNQTGVYDMVGEMQALPFRYLTDWCVLFLALFACVEWGKGKGVNQFVVITCLFGIFLTFRAQREMWFLVIPASVIIATPRERHEIIGRRLISRKNILIGLILPLAYSFILKDLKSVNAGGINDVLARRYPVSSVYVARIKKYEGPIYNDYDWGGFFIWQLPSLLVSIDGRANLHGDDRLRRSANTWQGAKDWTEDLELGSARLIIASQKKPLASLLRLDHRFDLVYEDEVSALFIAR